MSFLLPEYLLRLPRSDSHARVQSVFCTMVLPMAARNLDGRSGRSPHYNENLQVMQSYMTVCHPSRHYDSH